MSEVQSPLQGAAVYNPHLLSKEELTELFVVRRSLLDRLLADLRATSPGQHPQHHLLIGQRGMGKTMLLRRLRYAIEDDSELAANWVPLTFPEEQYNVARLSDFWLNCVDALSDALDRLGLHEETESLDAGAEALRSVEEEKRSRQALTLLLDSAQHLGRRLVLLVDNVDLIFERIDKQEWQLREALSSATSLVLIGASANAIESTFDYSKAFYDVFQMHELDGLSYEDMQSLILHYAKVWNNSQVVEVIAREPARLRTLHTLTGGNPRTAVLLFQVLAMGTEGDVRNDLERLLDQCTPLYKARFEALSIQAQQVVHAMAVHWDPISAGELAASMGIEVNSISSQLNRLVKAGVVERVEYEPATKTGFQIGERFFNIWYLMRASRRVRRRLVWLVEFLKMFYSQDQLRSQALDHLRTVNTMTLDHLRHAEYSFALADALDDPMLRAALENTGLRTLIEDEKLRRQLPELIDLEGTEPNLRERAESLRRLSEIKNRILTTVPMTPDLSASDLWQALRCIPLPVASVLAFADYYLGSEPQARMKFEKTLREQHKGQYYLGEASEALQEALSRGLMMDLLDREGAASAETVLHTSGLQEIAIFCNSIFNLVSDPGSVRSRFLFATMAICDDRWAEAAEQLRPAMDLVSPADPEAWPIMRVVFASAVHMGRAREAAQIFEDPDLASRWRPLREALEAAWRGKAYLRRVAPEVRRPAREILDQLLEEDLGGLGAITQQRKRGIKRALSSSRRPAAPH